MADTLLAHLAGSMPQKENLATEGLAFIANRYPAARDALTSEFSRLVDAGLPVARLVTQVAVGDESRPDVLLHAADGRLLGYLEAKFWAALTPAQPVEYLRRLADARGQALVLLAPARRLPTLRAEVVERCRAAGVGVEPMAASLLTCGSQRIGFVAWNRLLEVLATAVASDAAAASDVRQLAGLCNRFESEGFVPLTRQDIDDLDVPRRVLALAGLVNPIVDRAVADGILSVKGLRPSHSMGFTGRYAAFAHAGCWLGLTHQTWAAHGRSPLWVRFAANAWDRADQLREVFRAWAMEDPPRAFLDGDDRSVLLPLLLPTGVEQDAVVDAVVRQLREIDAKLNAAGLPPLSGAPAEP